MPSAWRAGIYLQCSVASERYQAFIPHPLPPDPSLSLNDHLYDLMEKANRALGRLDGITAFGSHFERRNRAASARRMKPAT